MKTVVREFDTFTLFFSGKDYMSNFYKSKIKAEYKGEILTFHCSEQLFMFVKALEFNSHDMAMKIHALGDVHPIEYKKIGRQLPDYEIYGDRWEDIKEDVMYSVVTAKFTQDKVLKKSLIATGSSVLVEASPYDKYWGAGYAASDPRIFDMNSWPGHNVLGEILEIVRDELRNSIYKDGYIMKVEDYLTYD